MALNANALVDLAELKRRIPSIAASDTSKDEELMDYINEVSQFVENFIGRPLKAADYTEYIAPNGEEFLLTRYFPINSVASVHVSERRTDVQELVENEDWYLEKPKQGELYRPNSWMKTGYTSYLGGHVEFPERNIKVVYNAGYETIPADIKGVVKDIIADNLKLEDAQGLKSFAISDVRWDWDKSFSKRQITILKQYKAYRF